MSLNFLWSILVLVAGIGITILWVVIAWRAMRAHESLAESHASLASDLKKIARAQTSDSSAIMQSPKISDLDPKVLPKFRD